MEETELTPWGWAAETWARRPLELLMPAGIGVAAAQFLTAAFALRSSHSILLLLCITVAAFALLQTVALFVRLSQDNAQGLATQLSTHDLYKLFAPLFGSVLLYAAIAPNARMGLFFAFASLPHFFALLYVAKEYAPEAFAAIEARLPTFEMIGAPVLQFANIVKTTVRRAKPVEKIPQIG